MMVERDNLLEEGDKNILYVVTPALMMVWMKAFVDDQIKHRDNIKLVISYNLNPEKQYYYQDHPNERFKVIPDELLDPDPRPLMTSSDCHPSDKS